MEHFLKFIGIGCAFNPEMGNTSAFMKTDNGERLVLFDCGEDVFKRIKSLGILNGVKYVDIFITHNHSDHMGSLGTLLSYLYYIHKIKANVYDIKKKSKLRRVLILTGVMGDIYTFNESLEGSRVELESNLVITGFPVKHYDTIDSTAYEIMYKDQLVLYTGDHNDKSIYNNTQILDLYDIIYTDCSCKNFNGNPHVYIGDLKSSIPRGIRDKVFCMHVESEEAIEQIKKLGFGVVERYMGN